jgi:hypothetical protein
MGGRRRMTWARRGLRRTVIFRRERETRATELGKNWREVRGMGKRKRLSRAGARLWAAWGRLTRFSRRGAPQTGEIGWGRETVPGGATDRRARRLGGGWGRARLLRAGGPLGGLRELGTWGVRGWAARAGRLGRMPLGRGSRAVGPPREGVKGWLGR